MINMSITLKDIIEKYDTNINVENIANGLKNKVIFSDKDDDISAFVDDITLDDIKEPKFEEGEYNSQKTETYTYKFKDYELVIDYAPFDYKTMTVEITKPTPEEVKEQYYTYMWNYKGEDVGVIY